jgi:ribosomal protein S9
MLGLVDVEVVVSGGGSSSQAGAIRYAIAMCLRSFVEKSVIDDMKICGLLTQVGEFSLARAFYLVRMELRVLN